MVGRDGRLPPKRTLDRWDDRRAGETIDLVTEMMDLTQRIIVRTMFSTDLGTGRGGRQENVADRQSNGSARRSGRRSWRRGCRCRRTGAFVARCASSTPWCIGLIDERKPIRTRRARPVVDACCRLATRRPASGMTDRQLRDEVMTMLLAGHETTSLALSWTYLLLSQHPDVEQRIADEARARDRRAGGRRSPTRSGSPTRGWSSTKSLRLYPPAWGFSRLALADDEIGGYRVPAGLARLHHPVRRAPPAEALARSGAIRSRAIHRRITRRSRPEVRVPAVRRRPAPVHRQSVRDGRSVS